MNGRGGGGGGGGGERGGGGGGEGSNLFDLVPFCGLASGGLFVPCGATRLRRPAHGRAQRRAVHHLPDRPVLSPRRDRRHQDPGATRVPRELPGGADVLRAAVLQQRVSRGGAGAGQTVYRDLRAVRLRRDAERELLRDGARAVSRTVQGRPCVGARNGAGERQDVRVRRVPRQGAEGGPVEAGASGGLAAAGDVS